MLKNNFTGQQQYKSYHIIIQAKQDAGALLLGDLNAATNQDVINEHNIKTIITAATGLQHLKIPSDLTHVVFPLMDTKNQNISNYFQLSYQTIQQNLKKGSVLVHCGAGISRSASLVIAYYMKKYQSQFKTAIHYVKKIRPVVCPNLGFELQLKKYQKILSNNYKQPNSQKKIQAQNNQNGIIRKQVQRPTSFLFQMPVQPNSVKKKEKPNYKTMSRLYNKAQGAYRQKQGQNDLFIQGKTALENKQFGNDFSVYDPQKYTRKSLAKKQLTSHNWRQNY